MGSANKRRLHLLGASFGTAQLQRGTLPWDNSAHPAVIFRWVQRWLRLVHVPPTPSAPRPQAPPTPQLSLRVAIPFNEASVPRLHLSPALSVASGAPVYDAPFMVFKSLSVGLLLSLSPVTCSEPGTSEVCDAEELQQAGRQVKGPWGSSWGPHSWRLGQRVWGAVGLDSCWRLGRAQGLVVASGTVGPTTVHSTVQAEQQELQSNGPDGTSVWRPCHHHPSNCSGSASTPRRGGPLRWLP